jgi:hypothetical protein
MTIASATRATTSLRLDVKRPRSSRGRICSAAACITVATLCICVMPTHCRLQLSEEVRRADRLGEVERLAQIVVG